MLPSLLFLRGRKNNLLKQWPSALNSFDFGIFEQEKEELRIPLANVEEQAEKYVIEAELPGFKKEETEIKCTDDHTISIHASRTTNFSPTKRNFILGERVGGRDSTEFFRSFTFPKPFLTDKISASLKNGVLEVTLPKQQPHNAENLQKIIKINED